MSSTSKAPKTPSSRLVGLTVPSLMVAASLGALEYLRGRFQHRVVFLPDRYPDGIWDPASFGMTVEDRWFETADGVQLHGWWISHPRARGTLLYCHGNSGSIGHRVALFRHLRRLRADLFVFDYRGYGRSTGTPSEKGLFEDVRAAYDHLTGALGRKAEEIVLFGHSLGGAVAIDVALHRDVAGLIVQSSFKDIKQMSRARFPQLPVHWLARNQFRSIEKVGDLEMPKLFIHGTADGTVPIEHGRALFEAAAEPKTWYEVPSAGHNDLHRHGGLRYLWKLGRFRSACLRRPMARGRISPEPAMQPDCP